MNRSKNIAALALAVSVSALAVTSASAQNPGFEAGNQILGFQTTGSGSANYVLGNIGDSTLFRDATSNLYNVFNIGSALTAQYGATWFNRTDLFVGTVASWSNDEEGVPTRLNDPYNTLYVGNPRQTIGVEGAPGSNGFSLTGNDIQQASNAIIAVGNAFETVGTSSIASIPAGGTFLGAFVDYDNQNPIAAGVQGNSYNGVFSGGVQQTFGPGTFGSFGGVAAEAALDLYRIDSTSGQSTFEGTVVIDNTGSVSYIVAPIPEPSTAVMFGLTAGIAGFMRRRRTVAA